MPLTLDNRNQYGLLGYAAPRCGVDGAFPADAEAFGIYMVDEDNPDKADMRGVVVMSSFSSTNCELSLATPQTRKWASRNVISGLFGYLFLVRKLQRVTTLTPLDNRLAMIANLKMGFQFEGRLASAGSDGGDLIVMGMTREMCPWLTEKEPEADGQEIQRTEV